MKTDYEFRNKDLEQIDKSLYYICLQMKRIADALEKQNEKINAEIPEQWL